LRFNYVLLTAENAEETQSSQRNNVCFSLRPPRRLSELCGWEKAVKTMWSRNEFLVALGFSPLLKGISNFVYKASQVGIPYMYLSFAVLFRSKAFSNTHLDVEEKRR